MISRSIRHTGILLGAAVLILSTGCQSSHPAASSKPSTSQSASVAERDAEVAKAIAGATKSTNDDDRALWALVMTDQALGGITTTVRSIDTARKICIDNLSNLDTTAYKRTVVRVGDGGKTVNSFVDFEQGSLENSGRSLDLAIAGKGFFRIKIADSIGGGVGYTRNGNFFINNKGDFVLGMGEGYRFDPPIKVPPNVTEISISQSGAVEVIQAGATHKTAIGQIKLTTFISPENLQVVGGSIYCQTDAAGPPIDYIAGEGGSGQLMQGFLEASNVDFTRERMRLQFLNDWRSTVIRAAGVKEKP
jgi:flagellar basal body rod protein FlgG